MTTHKNMRQTCNLRSLTRCLLSATTFGLLLASAQAQSGAVLSTTHFAPPNDFNNPSAITRNPRDWAVDVAQNEVDDIAHHDSYLRYRVHVIDGKGDRIRDVIEAREGTVARTILRDGRPLSDVEDKAERDRLTDLLSSPAGFAKHLKNDAEGKKLAVDLVRLMPDAMIYTYTHGQPQIAQPQSAHRQSSQDSSSHLAQPQIVLDYKPNPLWKSPTLTAEALNGLEGRMWIDPHSRQILRMEGTVFQGVNLGWGMLAHIYPGGKLVLEQTDAGSQRWIYTHFTEEATVRALMVKTMNVHTDVAAAAFQALPGPISYQDAIRMLLDTPPLSH
jgi:hypothetical protein